jgi:hypothetical protein
MSPRGPEIGLNSRCGFTAGSSWNVAICSSFPPNPQSTRATRCGLRLGCKSAVSEQPADPHPCRGTTRVAGSGCTAPLERLAGEEADE